MGVDNDGSRTDGAPMATGNAATSPTSALAWAGQLTDMIAKYDRNSERQLYTYGISVSRCDHCRQRIKADTDNCDNCSYSNSTKSRTCTRCGGNSPWLWCYECDRYFCEPCHKLPHVLVLGGIPPQKHHCYPTDGAPGTLMHRGAWSKSIFARAKAARRTQMKLSEDTAVNKPRQSNGSTQLSAMTENMSVDESTTGKANNNPDGATTTTTNSSRDPRRQVGRPPTVPTPSRQPSPPPVSTSMRQPTPPPTPIATGTATTNEIHAQQPPPPPQSRAPMQSRSPSPVSTTGHQPSITADAAGSNPFSVHRSHERPTIKSEITSSTTPTMLASRKRKSPTADTTATSEPVQQAPSQRPSPSVSQASTLVSLPAVEADGMSLYERLRQMHNKRQAPGVVRIKKEETNHQPPTVPPMVATTVSATVPSAQAPPQAPVPQLPQPPQPPQSLYQTHSAPIPETPAVQADPASAAVPTPQQLTQPMDAELEEALSQTIEPPPTSLVDLTSADDATMAVDTDMGTTGSKTSTPVTRLVNANNTPVAGANFASRPPSVHPSIALEDPLKVAVVEEYDRANDHALKVEERLEVLISAVRRASLQNVSHAATINERIGDYTKALQVAHEQRYRALAKVILFSPDIRLFARGLSQTQLIDIPHALTASHKKCHQLAQAIRDSQAKVQMIRSAIDEAVSSGDVNLLMQLQTLSGQIQELEEQIRQSKQDRDGQFKLMVQFSKKLREAVYKEMTTIREQAPPRPPSS